LLALIDVLGGPSCEATYSNGDRTAYATTVYEAEIVSGVPAVADSELIDVGWFGPGHGRRAAGSPGRADQLLGEARGDLRAASYQATQANAGTASINPGRPTAMASGRHQSYGRIAM
jgi:hypothetical protein